MLCSLRKGVVVARVSQNHLIVSFHGSRNKIARAKYTRIIANNNNNVSIKKGEKSTPPSSPFSPVTFHRFMMTPSSHLWNDAHNFPTQQQRRNKHRSSSTSSSQTTNIPIMDRRLIFELLQMNTFEDEEISYKFEEIHSFSKKKTNNRIEQEEEEESIEFEDLKLFLINRIRDLEEEENDDNSTTLDKPNQNIHHRRTNSQVEAHATELAHSMLKSFIPPNNNNNTNSITRTQFIQHLTSLSTEIDMPNVVPIAISMALVGSSVGMVTPIMPFVVEKLGLSAGQYGMVVSGFALSKMLGNVPSAVLVERHGRKPYLVHSLLLISIGVGGISLSTTFTHLLTCRLLTGLGVAALSTAAIMSITDISTTRNRASTMGPIMACFAGGMACGPGLGGMCVDMVGLEMTFGGVGLLYGALMMVNRLLLNETRRDRLILPWMMDGKEKKEKKRSIPSAMVEALQQWKPLLLDSRVRNVTIMNGFYWVGLAGSQMTLLPLILTDPAHLAMSASTLGKVYMGMSLVNVTCNPILSRVVDRVGKIPSIVAGCTMISSSMMILPLSVASSSASSDLTYLAETLGLWALGSTVLSTAPISYVSDIVRDEKRAQAIALLRTSGDVGFLLGASSVGALADYIGDLGMAMHWSAGVLFTATGWFGVRQMMLVKEGEWRSHGLDGRERGEVGATTKWRK